MFICVAMASLFGRGWGGGVGWGDQRDEKERIHSMTTKILQSQRHFLDAGWPGLGHGAQVREDAGRTAPCCRFYSHVAENSAAETAPPAICASSISAINCECVGCVWAPHIALQDLHDPMNINHLTRKTVFRNWKLWLSPCERGGNFVFNGTSPSFAPDL